jgi:hypothetical protein
MLAPTKHGRTLLDIFATASIKIYDGTLHLALYPLSTLLPFKFRSNISNILGKLRNTSRYLWRLLSGRVAFRLKEEPVERNR